MLNLAGRGAIIAGTRRVGATVVRRLAAEGVKPAIIYRSSRIEAEALVEEVRPMVGDAALIQADLTVEDEVRHAVATARSQLGDLSYCINCAADYPHEKLEALDAADWDRGIAAAKGSYLLALHAGRVMFENPPPTRGHIVLFGDWAAEETPYPDYLPYLTAKAAIHFMTRAFALEMAPYGVLVNAILPGPTAAPPDLPPGEWDEALDKAPLHRDSSDEEIAEVIATLLKLETMTGERIRVDSGRHIAGSGPRRLGPA